MYFDFEDYHPSIEPVGRALTRLEMVLLTIILHLLAVILLLVSPRWLPQILPKFLQTVPAPVVVQQPPRDNPRFVFVQPRLERPVLKAPERAEASDRDRQMRSPERPQRPPTNPLPYNRGNSPERIDELQRQAAAARGRGPDPDPAAGRPAEAAPPQSNAPQVSESPSAMSMPGPRPPAPQNGANGRSATSGGSLGDALRNLQRYTQGETFDNQGGTGGQFGPEIQFDTKGVEFGPWIRRFIAQVKRNWFIPYAAMSMKGHVVIQFNVHKDGTITDLTVVGPSAVDAFNNAAFGALSGSNPTQPLPPEYPDSKAFFTVTFFYNEAPPR
jgi:TonB family protein